MPPQTVAPSYNFLLEQMRDTNAATESEKPKPFDFSHLLFVSKTYIEVDSMLDDTTPSKKKKGNGAKEAFYFHAEDEVFDRHAIAAGDFEYTKQGADGASDARRAFQEVGIRPVGHLILMEAARFRDAVKDVEAFVTG